MRQSPAQGSRITGGDKGQARTGRNTAVRGCHDRNSGTERPQEGARLVFDKSRLHHRHHLAKPVGAICRPLGDREISPEALALKIAAQSQEFDIETVHFVGGLSFRW